MAWRTPGVSAVPVAASVMRAYCLSALGKAMTVSEVSCFWRMWNAWSAFSGKGPDLYPESFCVSLNNGAEIRAKSLMWVWKKLQRPTNDQMVLISVGGLAS